MSRTTPIRETHRSSVDMHPRDAWTAFGLGVLGGVVAGLTLLSFAGLQPLGLLAIAVGVSVRPRPFGAAGGLLAIAGTWLMLFAGAATRCDPASCTSPDLTPWVAASLAIGAIGVVVLGLGIRRARASVP